MSIDKHHFTSGRIVRWVVILAVLVLLIAVFNTIPAKNGQETADQIAENIQIIVGGAFGPDHLGEERYQEIIQHVLERPDDYLDKFREMYFGMNYTLSAHADRNMPQFLLIVNQSDSDVIRQRVRHLAEVLIAHYSTVLKIYDEVTNQEQLFADLPEETQRFILRLDERRTDLQLLLKNQ